VSGPCLSSSVAGRPLRPATRHRLGEPLPHQLADRPRGHQEAPGCPGFDVGKMSSLIICGINSPFGELSPTSRQIPHVLRTRSPLNNICIATNVVPFDLHVLSTPPAFVLSQNQTLRKNLEPESLLTTGQSLRPSSLTKRKLKSDHSCLLEPVGPAGSSDLTKLRSPVRENRRNF
jgi:hypothetical protein